MTFSRAAASHIMIDFDKFACNLKSKHNAAVSRRVTPELCFVVSPSNVRGRREDRVPAGTRGPLCESCATKLAQRHTGEAGNNPAFPAQWFDGLCRALPGERCTIAPVALQIADVRTRSGTPITARLGAQTPGARTTRFCRTRTAPVVCATPLAHGCPPCEALRADVAQRPPQLTPHVVTIAIRPSDRDELVTIYGKSGFR
ncbi:hypothetical protein ABIB73_000140 [Bradyrhizobium sp. F1.4.3]